jgi:hypothetical protein
MKKSNNFLQQHTFKAYNNFKSSQPKQTNQQTAVCHFKYMCVMRRVSPSYIYKQKFTSPIIHTNLGFHPEGPEFELGFSNTSKVRLNISLICFVAK